MARIALVTERYPYVGLDSVFVKREIEVLSEEHEITVFPTSSGESSRLDLPNGTTHTDALLLPPVRSSILEYVPEIVVRNRRMLGSKSGASFSLANHASQLVRAARATWIQRNFAAWLNEAPPVDLVYSWWGFPPAFGVARALEGTGTPFVMRVHGYDLFPEQDKLGFIPFQEALLRRAAAVFSVSTSGAEYLRSRYPRWAERVQVAHLGVSGPETQSRPSIDGVFRLVTCSSVVPVKRLDRMVTVVKFLRSQGMNITWTHLGDGPLLQELQEAAEPVREFVHFIGQVPHDQVMAWLTDQAFDLFCNVSDSEGLPVSLMEAAACGIPLLALDVGGIREIVSSTNGKLLPASSSPNDIGEAIKDLAARPISSRLELRRASRRHWSRFFRAEKNYAAFSRALGTYANGA